MWVHANAIDYDPVQDVYIVSFATWDALYAFDRQTGRPADRHDTVDPGR